MLIPLVTFGAQNFWWGVWGRWRLWHPCQSPTGLRERVLIWEYCIPADLGPSHHLLPWHLLRGSFKGLANICQMCSECEGIPPWWREWALNELWIFCLYFPSEVSQQGEMWGLSLVCCSVVPAAEFAWMWVLSSAVLPCFCWKPVPSGRIFISILGRCSSPAPAFSPRIFPPGCRGFSWIPGLWQDLLSVVSLLSANCLLELGYETD